MENLKKVWDNPQYKSLMKLGMWFLFLLLVVLMCCLSGNRNVVETKKEPVEEKVEQFESLENLKNKLLLNNYKYSFKVNNIVEQNLMMYNGELYEGLDKGYYESKTEVFKYSCTLEKCYKVFTDHDEEYEMEIYPLLFLDVVFDFINNVTPEVVEESNMKIYKYINDVQGNNWEVVIKITTNDIVSITLNNPKEIYEFNIIK